MKDILEVLVYVFGASVRLGHNVTIRQDACIVVSDEFLDYTALT
jgi:hypothetical protein